MRIDRSIDVKVSVEKRRDIFDESQSRALLEVSDSDLEEVLAMASGLGLRAEVIGKIGGDDVSVNGIGLSLEKVKDVYFNMFARTIEQDL